MIVVLALGTAVAVDGGRVSAQSAGGDDPDALYAGRAEGTNARRAADIWKASLARNPNDFESAWKLARACYWLGGHAAQSERRGYLQTGIDAGQAAARISPNRPEGHFWAAATMGALAESGGMRAGLRYRKPIKDKLETVLRLDPGFQQGSADRALGRWYFKVPGLFGGSRTLAEQHLRASLTYNAQSTASHYFLAEVLADDDRESEAREELQRVLDAPLDPEWTPEDREFKEQAKQMLARLSR
jgi:hypothetical protein